MALFTPTKYNHVVVVVVVVVVVAAISLVHAELLLSPFLSYVCVSLNDPRGNPYKINLTTPQSLLRVYHICEHTAIRKGPSFHSENLLTFHIQTNRNLESILYYKFFLKRLNYSRIHCLCITLIYILTTVKIKIEVL